jgi:DNA invertase Pin-like site-specific DNA recombinase
VHSSFIASGDAAKRRTIMDAYATKFHRDGTVTVWNVYRQGWERTAAADVDDRILASLSEAERARIAKLAILASLSEAERARSKARVQASA